jgi:hypothetical protein
MSKETFYSDYKMIDDGVTYIKVIGFPGRESMWVVPLEGGDNKGVGTIANKPVCSDLRMGAKVKYGGGTKTSKPQFLGVI